MPPQNLLSKKNNPRRGLAILFGLGVFLSVSSALPAYIQSNFLGQFINIQAIGSVFVFINLISIVTIILFPKAIKRLSNYTLAKAMVIIYGLSLFGLALSSSALSAIIAITMLMVSANLLWINMDILVESFSHNKSTGRTRTLYFTFINIGWILSPLASAYLVSIGNYSLSFFVSALIVIPCFFVLNRQEKILQQKTVYEDKGLPTTIKRMWQDKNRRSIFFVALLLQIFYSSAVIYIPFHLLNNLGMSWSVLGPIFSLMLLPFILIQIPAGIIADKYLGEKEMLITGFLVLSFSLFMFYYIQTPTAWLWAAILFLSRIGAALIEAMRESYFFKIVDVEHLQDINLFRVTGPLGWVFASGLTVIIMNFYPLHYLFMFLAIAMLSGVVFSAVLKDSK